MWRNATVRSFLRSSIVGHESQRALRKRRCRFGRSTRRPRSRLRRSKQRWMDRAVATSLGDRPQFFWNRGGNLHWLTITLRGKRSNRDGFGARVQLNGQVRFATAAGGYLSSNDKAPAHDLGNVQSADIEIEVAVRHSPDTARREGRSISHHRGICSALIRAHCAIQTGSSPSSLYLRDSADGSGTTTSL